jgi:DNA polymerase III subunit delta
MIKLFYGDDTYSLNKALKNLEQDFFNANFGDININKFDGASLTYDNFVRSVSAVPFLADKRLIIISGLIKNGDGKLRDYLSDNLKKIPDSAEVILVEEGEVAKNLKIFKTLAKSGAINYFPLRKGYELEKWLINYARDKKIPLPPVSAKKLIATAGNNAWRLINELEKLDLYRIGQRKNEIKENDIDSMVQSENDPNIFDFIDSIGARNAGAASKHLDQLLTSGKNENYILSMIVYQFRNLLIIEDLIIRGVEKKRLAKEADIHPFVVTKAIKVLDNFDLRELKKVYAKLLRTDLDIKTGAVEPKLALEKLLADLTL